MPKLRHRLDQFDDVAARVVAERDGDDPHCFGERSRCDRETYALRRQRLVSSDDPRVSKAIVLGTVTE